MTFWFINARSFVVTAASFLVTNATELKIMMLGYGIASVRCMVLESHGIGTASHSSHSGGSLISKMCAASLVDRCRSMVPPLFLYDCF